MLNIRLVFSLVVVKVVSLDVSGLTFGCQRPACSLFLRSWNSYGVRKLPAGIQVDMKLRSS